MKPRRRDRHGQGLRGPLCPPQTRLGRSRAARFDDYVLDSFQRLEQRWPKQLRQVEVAVVDVPSVKPAPAPSALADLNESPEVDFGRIVARHAHLPTRIIVYRWPLERRARGSVRGLADLVHMVMVHQVAQLLGLPAEQVDPSCWADEEGPEDGPAL